MNRRSALLLLALGLGSCSTLPKTADKPKQLPLQESDRRLARKIIAALGRYKDPDRPDVIRYLLSLLKDPSVIEVNCQNRRGLLRTDPANPDGRGKKIILFYIYPKDHGKMEIWIDALWIADYLPGRDRITNLGGMVT